MAFHSSVRWFIPWLGVGELEKAIVNISAIVEELENSTLDVIWALQEEVASLSKMVFQKLMVLDLLLVFQGGVCSIINAGCCMYVEQTGQIETDLKNIWEKTKILCEVAQDNTSWVFRDIWGKTDLVVDWIGLAQATIC